MGSTCPESPSISLYLILLFNFAWRRPGDLANATISQRLLASEARYV